MKKTNIFILKGLLILTIFSSCSGIKKTTATLPSDRSFSPQVRLLWNDIAAETNNFKNIKNYIPSDSIIEKYPDLLHLDKIGIISGFIYYNSDFNTLSVDSLNGSIVTYADKIATFRIPAAAFDRFIRLKGITRVESAKKVKIPK